MACALVIGCTTAKPATVTGGATGGATRSPATGGTTGASQGAGGSSISASGAGGTRATTGGTADAATDATSSSVVDQLKEYLAVPRAQRKPVDDEPFARIPLGREDAAQAADLLWQDYAASAEVAVTF